MDGSQFDLLTRTIAASISRRVTLGGLAGGVLAVRDLVQAGSGLARKKGKKKNKNKGKKKNKKKKCPNGRDRCGNKCCKSEETCQQGKCVNCCQDGVQNCGETDIDCGRVCAGIPGSGLCGLRRKCAGAEDCTSGKCTGGECVECLIDSECTSPIFRRCLDNFCFECAIDADCPSSFGSPTERLCVVIEDCPRNQPCVCRQCRQDADCPSQRPHCNTGVDSSPGKLCFECLQDDHCPPGQLCDEQGRCEGFACTSNQDCPTGRACENGACTGVCVPAGGNINDEGECCSGVECISGPDDICCDFGQSCIDTGSGDQCV